MTRYSSWRDPLRRVLGLSWVERWPDMNEQFECARYHMGYWFHLRQRWRKA